jgi:hypothetical protein
LLKGETQKYPPFAAFFRFAGRPGEVGTGHGCAPLRDAPPVVKGGRGDFDGTDGIDRID